MARGYAVADADRGRNEPCTCGSGRKWKQLSRDRADAIARIAPAATLAGRGGGLADSGKPWLGLWIRGLRSLLRLGTCAGQVG